MSVEELVKRLRHNYEMWALGSKGPPILVEAADKLEELAAENKRLKRELSATVAERNRAQEACQQISENTEAALAEAKRENEALREALEAMLEPYEDDPCRYDHHGYCQSHFLQEDCCVAEARAALARNAGGKDAE